MKNIKVRTKLIVGFAIVLVFMIILSITAINGLYTLNNADTQLFERNFVGTEKAYSMLVNLTGQRTQYRDVIMAIDKDDATSVDNAISSLRNEEKSMKEMMEDYDSWATLASAIEAFQQFKSIYESSFSDSKEKLITSAKSGDLNGAQNELDLMAADYKSMSEFLNTMVSENAKAGQDKVNANTDTYYRMIYIQSALVVLAVIITVGMVIYISMLIAKPLRYLSAMLGAFASTGYLQLDESATYKSYAVQKDEIGDIARSVSEMTHMLNQKIINLEGVANGDLTAEINQQSENDSIANALRKMVDNLNKMFWDINKASIQVSDGSKQVANGSQVLAQGSTEQASVVEELSASMNEIASKTNSSADLAKEAATLSENIKISAEKGNQQMDQLVKAVNDINESSNSISKIIKIIDDIAFQTNILALNAAVEAARAGQHGKGFAVVAGEVRNLAAKSADAVKDTENLIEDTKNKVQVGLNISNETSISLEEIVQGINKSVNLVAKIAKASDVQAKAITQVNSGVDQVAQVVQQNSATAQESAAASEEMSSQSILLQQLISTFKLKGNKMGSGALSQEQGYNHYKEQSNMQPQLTSYDDYNKY